ncbi:hypothetical protein FACUT_3025 [Fusarium acutatum]|uniref:Ecp2 effector protein-like domain-containing protein n=1 Tax=Fusarium acutatum TaxID=78861 RepID=A0A8H4JZQ9_9HYPO|nr:hypothetical protein FACUT_3025 [Fusarium acutatum]
MHLLRLFIASLTPATLINGLPIQGNHEQNNASTLNSTIVSHVRVRRDVPLTARDIEEADQHGVDLNKMYKHSILKHSDGSDYSIWVHNSFDPDVKDDEKSANDAPALGKRWEESGSANDRMPNRFEFDEHTDTCGKSDWKKRTDKHSPFVIGADAIIEWTWKNKGGWRIAAEDAYYSTDLLISGTNTGANMRFSVRKDPGRFLILGTKDVRDVTSEAYRRFKKKISGVWRMAGKGKMKCWDGNEEKNMLRWEIDRSDRDIEAENMTQEQPAPKPTPQEGQHQEPGYQPEPAPAPQPVYVPVPVAPVPVPVAPVAVPVPVPPQPVYPPAPPSQPDTVHHVHHHVEETQNPAPAPPPDNHMHYHNYNQATYQQGSEPTPAPQAPPPVSEAPMTEVSQSIPPGGYRPGEGPPGFPESSSIYTSSYYYSGKPGWKPQSAEATDW